MVQLATRWEMLLDNAEECSSDVRLDAFTKRRVEPNDVPSSISLFPSSVDIVHVLDLFTVAAGFKRTVIKGGRLVEYVLIIGYCSYTSAYRCWQVPDYCRRVVRLLVDIYWVIIWFSEWVEFAVVEVECNIQEVYNLEVCFDRYLQPEFTEDSAYIFLGSFCRADRDVLEGS